MSTNFTKRLVNEAHRQDCSNLSSGCSFASRKGDEQLLQGKTRFSIADLKEQYHSIWAEKTCHEVVIHLATHNMKSALLLQARY